MSHKDDWIAVATSDKPVGIDIETNSERSTEVFRAFTDGEWQILGKRSWKNFYQGWTAKEAFLKAFSLKLENISDIRIIQRTTDTVFLSYEENKAAAKILTEEEYIFAFCQTDSTLIVSEE